MLPYLPQLPIIKLPCYQIPIFYQGFHSTKKLLSQPFRYRPQYLLSYKNYIVVTFSTPGADEQACQEQWRREGQGERREGGEGQVKGQVWGQVQEQEQVSVETS